MIVDPREIGALAAEAATRTGISAWQYEKDYYATLVLGVIASELDGLVLFKGGTSLSKAYGLINRFSEDLDLLVLADGSGDPAESIMDRIEKVAASARANLTVQRSPDRYERGVSRVINVQFTAVNNREAGASRKILLEPGIQGGPLPQERRTVSAMLANAMPTEASRLPSFEVDVLHPARTLIEKLLIAVRIGQRLAGDPSAQMRSREARHFYDIYRLLDLDGPALTHLQATGQFSPIARECMVVTKRYYPDQDSHLEPRIADAAIFTTISPTRTEAPFVKVCQELCHPGATVPSWTEVLERVASVGDLLVIEEA